MSKVIDITDRLTFEGNPKLKIKNEEIEVNADAPSVLKIMGVMKDDGDSMKAYEILFSEKDRKKIEKMKLSFKDLTKVIEAAMNLATGEDDDPGER